MLSVEDWAEIRRLHRAEGISIKAIVRTMGISRNTVRAALASDGPPRYVRRPAGSVVDAVEPRIRELLKLYPRMPATVIAERIGWAHGITVLKARVAELRPAYLPPDPASRTSYAAGGFPPVGLPVRLGSAACRCNCRRAVARTLSGIAASAAQRGSAMPLRITNGPPDRDALPLVVPR